MKKNFLNISGKIESVRLAALEGVAKEDFDYVRAGARLLGRDIAAILSSDLKDRVVGILDKETGKKEEYKLIEDILMSKTLINVDFDSLLGLLEELKQGILERI